MLDETGMQSCQAAFYTLQAHHDYCEHGDHGHHSELVHDYEAACHSCDIPRKYNPEMEAICPNVDCNDSELAILSHSILKRACTPISCCESVEEIGAFQILTAYHDECDARHL